MLMPTTEAEESHFLLRWHNVCYLEGRFEKQQCQFAKEAEEESGTFAKCLETFKQKAAPITQGY